MVDKISLEFFRVGDINFIRVPDGEDGMYLKVQDISLIKPSGDNDCQIVTINGGKGTICNISPDQFMDWLVNVTQTTIVSKGD